MTDIYISLGSNLGDRKENLRAAIDELENMGFELTASSIYRTAGWGDGSLMEFYNQVVYLKSNIEPYSLLKKLKEIEKKLGRGPSPKTEQEGRRVYQDRIIDLDILYMDNEVIDSEDLSIPHPQIPLRRFVLEPLSEIAPNLIDPRQGIRVNQLLKKCPDDNLVVKLT